jgi:3-hydroxymyristoyl/3-hydroxydecanoyl-(acyl carrier protein) dehydratase
MAMGEQIVVRFKVRCFVKEECVFECVSAFGLFAPAALAETKGMVPSAAEREAFAGASNCSIELASSRERYRIEKQYELPGPRLLRLDRVTGLWPKGGAQGLGSIRGEKEVRKRDWVFKAHFYQDPVQPGSIGVESIMQLVKLFVLETETIPDGHRSEFESVLVGHEFQWTYRGQVLPKHRRVTVEFEVKARAVHDDGVTVTGEGRLWVDGKKIYQVSQFGTRLRFVSESVLRLERGRTSGAESLLPMETGALRRAFEAKLGTRGPFLQDLFLGLILQFVARFDVADPEEYAALKEKPVLYLANHQVGLESMLFVSLVDVLNRVPCRAIAKDEHRDSWMGRIMRLVREQTGRESIVLFNRADPSALLDLLNGAVGPDGRLTYSLLAHVQGTRALRAGEPTTQVSSALLDLALRCGLPIVPVKFSGGLPREPLSERLDFPFGFGRQSYSIGRIIRADELRSLTLLERKARVIEAINQTGSDLADDAAAQPNEPLARRVAELQSTVGLPLTTAVLMASLESVPQRSRESDALLDGITRLQRGERSPALASIMATLGVTDDQAGSGPPPNSLAR